MVNNRIAVVVFKSREDENQTSDGLLDFLARRGDVEVIAVPHLVDIAADGEVMRHLREIDGPMLVVGQMQARAIHWLLEKNGLQGPFVEVQQGRAGQGRAVWCLGIVGLEASMAVEACGDCLDGICERLGIVVESGQNSEMVRIDEPTSTRWYPVVDFERCTNCLECLNFCLFGVFGLDESESLAIDQPDACRPGCPACSRICPQGAIMFPDHHDPAISGDPQASSEGLKLDLSQLFGSVDPAALDPTAMAALERNRAMTEKKADDRRPPEPKPRGDGKKMDLDSLVDGLDELEL